MCVLGIGAIGQGAVLLSMQLVLEEITACSFEMEGTYKPPPPQPTSPSRTLSHKVNFQINHWRFIALHHSENFQFKWGYASQEALC